MTTLEQMKLIKNTIIILTADHGEELYDHGYFDRFGTGNLYDENIHVPFIMLYPDNKSPGRRIKNQIQLVDIMPTLKDLLNLPMEKSETMQRKHTIKKQHWDGNSFASLLKDGKKINITSEAYSSSGNKFAIRTNEWKLIYSPREFELYNLKEDPQEQHNLIKKEPEVALPLVAKLFGKLKDAKTKQKHANTIILDKEMRKKLKEAGYW